MSQWSHERFGPKACTGCGTVKLIEEFGRRRRTPNGRKSRCKACEKDRQREWAAANHDKLRVASRKAYRDNAEAIKARTADYKKRNREKSRAHSTVRFAVKSGRLAKPEACESCGGKGAVQGHHHDYSKPFDVEWLCARCHKRLHTAVA